MILSQAVAMFCQSDFAAKCNLVGCLCSRNGSTSVRHSQSKLWTKRFRPSSAPCCGGGTDQTHPAAKKTSFKQVQAKQDGEWLSGRYCFFNAEEVAAACTREPSQASAKVIGRQMLGLGRTWGATQTCYNILGDQAIFSSPCAIQFCLLLLCKPMDCPQIRVCRLFGSRQNMSGPLAPESVIHTFPFAE